MMEIDRRTVLRGVLFGVGLITVGGVAVTTTPQPANAVPLAKPEAVLRAEGKTDPVGSDDPLEGRVRVELVQWGYRRWGWRHRRRWWWRHRRRWWWRHRRRW